MVLFFAASNSSVFAYSFGPPNGLTDAPGEGNCTQCHFGNSLNASGGTLVLGVPGTYLPGEMYDIVVDLSRSGQSRWGFEMTALNGNGARAGTFTPANNGNTQVTAANSKQYIKQTTQGSASGTRDKNQWAFKWTAPTNDVGPITFYAAGNAANGDFGTSGDYIYTQKATSEVPVYGVMLAGVGSLTTQTTDASAAVTYTLKVTNTGNTNDTINLSTSGDASATLSPTTVPLDAGAARNVTLTVSGNVLTTAGDYEVKVKATSQGDSTKTAEVTTTTTVPPVYEVTLTGVSDLTTETTDASGGMKYTLRVTNTGNTSDKISLAVSGIAKATLNKTSVPLAAGASENVVLAIPGSSLATAGDYAAKVTATSQGDNAKTAEITTTTTILPVYGVTLTGIGDLTTETTDAGGGVKYILRVTNTGNTSDTVSLAVSGDAKATLNKTSVPLAAGASENVILTITGSSLATAGDYAAKVTATSQGDNAKTAEITTTTTILPVYGVTLTGIGDLATETTDASGGMKYILQVTNTGNTSDKISLAVSGIAKATLNKTSVSLAAGASENFVLAIPGSSLATAGDYAAKVTATSQGDNAKTAEITTTTTILPVYGVTLAGVGDLMTETSDASEGVSYTLKITNISNTDDVIDLTTSGDAAATLSQDSVSLAAGASTEVTLTVSDAVLTTAGDYEVKVTATSQRDNTKTVVISAKTTILPVYGVTLQSEGELKDATMDMLAGVSYTLTVTNTGNTDDTVVLGSSVEFGIEGSVLGSFSQSDDQEPTTSQLEIMLAAGASAEVIFTAAGDFFTKPGEYEIKVTATSQGDTEKTAEVSTKTTILPVYGVTLTGVGDLMTETSDASEGVSYMLTVTNTGNTDDTVVLGSSVEFGIEGSVLGSFSQSADQEPTTSQLEIMLAAGASAEVIFTAAGDFFTKPGEYEIKVTATSQGDTEKTAEVSTKTTILPVYGVTLQSEGELKGATMDMLAGVSYTLTVTNTGNTEDTVVLGSSAEFGIEGSVLGSFSQSDDQEPTTSQLEIMLAAGASAEVIFTAAGDFFTKPGEYEIKVTATSQGDTEKTAEVSTKTTILPVYGVTLQSEGELKGATMDMLAGVSYTLTVTNTGNTEDTVVLGSSAEFGIEGSVLGSFSQSADQEPTTSQLEIMLAAGASAEVIFTAAGDFFTKPGEYEIKVTATSQGDSKKTAELTTNTTIEPVPWDLNADGTVNILDLVAVANQLGESGEGLSGDVNMDGEVNILDLVQVASYFGETHAEIVQAQQ